MKNENERSMLLHHSSFIFHPSSSGPIPTKLWRPASRHPVIAARPSGPCRYLPQREDSGAWPPLGPLPKNQANSAAAPLRCRTPSPRPRTPEQSQPNILRAVLEEHSRLRELEVLSFAPAGSNCKEATIPWPETKDRCGS